MEIKTKPTTIRISAVTKQKLKEIMMMKAKEAQKEDPKRFIEAIVKNRGQIVPYDKALNFLMDFYLECIKHYEKLSLAEKKKGDFGKILKKIGKLNAVY